MNTQPIRTFRQLISLPDGKRPRRVKPDGVHQLEVAVRFCGQKAASSKQEIVTMHPFVTFFVAVTLMRAVVLIKEWAVVVAEVTAVGAANCSVEFWVFVAVFTAYTAYSFYETRVHLAQVADVLKSVDNDS